MANHKSSEKRIRQTETKRLHNRYFVISMRNLLKKIRSTTSKPEAEEMFGKVQASLQKLAKRNMIHKNKAANIISGLQVRINNMK